jgi:hypothetical protein
MEDQSMSELSDFSDLSSFDLSPPEFQHTSWTIHVLDQEKHNHKKGKKEGELWFRIYFSRENDYAYYKGAEILNYVRDLVELNGRSVFYVQQMSTGTVATVSASKIMRTLEKFLQSAAAATTTAKQQEGANDSGGLNVAAGALVTLPNKRTQNVC